MTYEVTIRPAVAGDAFSLAEMHVATWRVAYRGIVPDALLNEMSVAERTEGWHTTFADSTRYNLIAETQKRIAGFVSFGPAKKSDAHPAQTAEVYGLYVHPDFWRGGYGRILMNAALAALCADGYQVVVLWTWERNERARAFYEQTGWVLGGASVESNRFGLPLTEVCYRRELAQQ